MSSMKASRTKQTKFSTNNEFPKHVVKGKPLMDNNGTTKNHPSGGKKAMHTSKDTGHPGL